MEKTKVQAKTEVITALADEFGLLASGLTPDDLEDLQVQGEVTQWLDNPAAAVVATFEQLEQRNANRRVGQTIQQTNQTVDYEAFVTRRDAGDREPEEFYQVFTKIPTVNDGSKPYSQTRYEITLFSNNKEQLITVDFDGELAVFEQNVDGAKVQLSGSVAEGVLMDYFYRALIAEVRQKDRADNAPDEASIADADALAKVRSLTGILERETALE